MSAKYLTHKIAESRRTPIDPRRYLTRDGYTKLRGAPSNIMVRLDGETIWRRVMIWQFSNAGTCFVRVAGECLIVPEHDIPSLPQTAATDPA